MPELSKTKVTPKILCDRLAIILEKKNKDYGDSFHKQFSKFGMVSALIRISDKFNRLDNLITTNAKPEVSDESVKDTLMDLAGYCIKTLEELENR